MNPAPPKVVYDCNIYVQALISPTGPSGQCVAKARGGETMLFVTPFILTEIRESYRKIPPKHGVTQEQADALAAAVAGFATILQNVPVVFNYDRDPDDAHYVNLALAVNARLIVSRDRDLLDLMDNSRPEAVAFQQRFPTLRILQPVQFLQQLALDKPASNA